MCLPCSSRPLFSWLPHLLHILSEVFEPRLLVRRAYRVVHPINILNILTKVLAGEQVLRSRLMAGERNRESSPGVYPPLAGLSASGREVGVQGCESLTRACASGHIRIKRTAVPALQGERRGEMAETWPAIN
jgi:hypothetical protein